MTEVEDSNKETLDLQDKEVKQEAMEDKTEVSNDVETSPKRVCLPEVDAENEDGKLDKDQLMHLWKDQEKYVDYLENKLNSSDSKDEKVGIRRNNS